MDHLRTEEEQTDALKKWWSENGNALLIGIGLALAAIFGWKAWQQNQKDQKEQVSMMFFELNQTVTAAQSTADEDVKGQRSNDIIYLAKNLEESFPNSEYANFARLYQVKQLVLAGDYDAAEALIDSIDISSVDKAMASIINIRMARVKAAQKNYEEAIALLTNGADDMFYGLYQELKGDILKMKGDRAGAKAAYQNALANARQLSQSTQLLQYKIDDLADV